MKKSAKLKVLKMGTFVSGALALLTATSDFILKRVIVWALNTGPSVKDAEAIGIIGGADGPTVIFLGENSKASNKPIWSLIFLLMTGIFFTMWKKQSKLKE